MVRLRQSASASVSQASRATTCHASAAIAAPIPRGCASHDDAWATAGAQCESLTEVERDIAAVTL